MIVEKKQKRDLCCVPEAATNPKGTDGDPKQGTPRSEQEHDRNTRIQVVRYLPATFALYSWGSLFVGSPIHSLSILLASQVCAARVSSRCQRVEQGRKGLPSNNSQ